MQGIVQLVLVSSAGMVGDVAASVFGQCQNGPFQAACGCSCLRFRVRNEVYFGYAWHIRYQNFDGDVMRRVV
jgi:hypothetical protein